MTPEAQAIADAADANLLPLLSVAEKMQAAYFTEHGRFWQGLWTQPEPPADGEPATPDPTTHPTDQMETWLDTGAANLFPPLMLTRLAVDTYGGPLGQGWIVLVEFASGGRVYHRAIDMGPENRGFGWEDADAGGL